MSSKTLFGFHAVGVRLRTAPASVSEVHVDAAELASRPEPVCSETGHQHGLGRE